MFGILVDYRIDAVFFGLLLWSGAAICHVWLRRQFAAGLKRKFWLLLAILTLGAVFAAARAGASERTRLRDALVGIAPTYAQELSLLGHSRIHPDTPAADPLYLKLIEAEIRWLKVNPVVNDIYTMRRDADGKVRLVVDSETDYNHNGKYDEDREARTDIGEDYPEVTENMHAALDGVATFDAVPVADRWGTWVSAYAPIYNERGQVDAILGVDYDAHTWQQHIAGSRLTALSLAGVLGVILISTSTTLAVNHAEMRRRRKIEEALRTSESRLRTILDNEPECVNVIDVSAAGMIQEMNPAGLTMLEVAAPAEVIGKPFISFVDAPDHKAFQQLHEKACAGERTSLQFQVIGNRGGRRWLESQNVPLYDGAGQVISILSVARDITRRRLAEQEREQLQQQLVDASRQAGMAEIAIGVLHNVGNVLNSVNVSANLINDKLRQSKVANLGKATQMMQSHQQDLAQFITEDEKGKQLPSYLAMLSQFMAEEHTSMLSELQSMTQGLEHVKEVVRMQQSFAKSTSPLQALRPDDLFEEALKVNLLSVERHKIDLIREFAPCPPTLFDKHQTLQILVNLISNAKNAVKESPLEPKQVTLRLRRQETGGAVRIVFEVQDNGVGIRPEHFTRVFSHGFTTRRDGHGFGLHSAATSAQTMGGQLTCHSDGLGTGATFTLSLPCEAQKAEAA